MSEEKPINFDNTSTYKHKIEAVEDPLKHFNPRGETTEATVRSLFRFNDSINGEIKIINASSKDFSRCTFEKIKFKDSNFSRADLREAWFDTCVFIQSTFDFANLEDAHFYGLQLFMNCSLKGANLRNLKSDILIFDSSDLQNADITGSKIVIKDTNIQGAKLENATVHRLLGRDEKL